MLRRLSIRAKVLAVLAVPVLVLLVIATLITFVSVGEVRTAATVRDVVSVLPLSSRAVEALQQERTLSEQTAADKPLSGNLAAARAATDTAVTELRAATLQVDFDSLDVRVREAAVNADAQHGRIADIRSRLDAGTLPASLVDSNYTDIIDADNDVTAVVAETLSARDLASRLSAYAAIAGSVERVLHASPVAQDVLADDGADAGRVRELSALFAVQEQERAEARELTNNLRLDDIQLPSRDADLIAMQLALTSGNPAIVGDLETTRWNALVNAELAALRPVATDLLESADAQAAALETEARDGALFTVGLTVAATVLSIFVAFLVSRGIVVPLRRLTAAAGRVREELPRLVEQVAVPGESPDLTLADIPVESQDEVGRLAQAFNDVNATTIQVAREQAALRGSIAEMFVNVARRDQVLLGRQLAFIDSLERSEEDPAALANLFRLDHLATRMRRNAESLLVLAGIDSGRRLREAMPLSDVVRTASSEIEQYDRVQLELHADPLMHGFNALGAAHLLAELLENATLFSEPGTPVVVETGVDGDQVVVRIIDQGLGMSSEELEAANRTISSTSPTEALGAQRLGLFVVARLAQRLGARVLLKRARGDVSGTAAVVSFPVGLFTANDPALAGTPQRPAPAAVTAAQPEAPAAVPVDLAALTDGATDRGLPRRRTAGDTGAPARSSVPTEQDVVLPAPAEATLAPEIAAEASDWAPLVAPAPDAPAALPSRGSLPSRGALPSRVPAEPEAPAPAPAPAPGPRTGLFSGFRGRDAAAAAPDATPDRPADAQPADAEPAAASAAAPAPEAGPEAPATPEPVAPFGLELAEREPEISAADHARLDALSAPLTASLPQVAPAAAAERTEEPDGSPAAEQPAAEHPEAAQPEAESSAEWSGAEWSEAARHEAERPADEQPAAPAGLVVPGLVPDEPGTEPWATWAQTPPAPAEPAPSWAGSGWADATPASEPAAEVAPSWAQPAAWATEPQQEPAEPVGAQHADPAPAAEPAWQPAEPAAAEPVAAAPVAEPAPQAQPAAPVSEPARAWHEQAASAAVADAPALPDFATLVRGDDTEPEPTRRRRERRPLFSFRRKPAETADAQEGTAAPAAPAPQPAAPVAPERRPALPAAASAPAAPAAPVPTWLPAAGAAVEAAEAPTRDGGAQWAPSEPAAWSPSQEQAWSAPQATAEPAAPAAPVLPPAPVLPAAPAWSATPDEPAAGTPGWGTPTPPPAAAAPLPTRTRGAVPPPAPEPAVAPAERRPHRDISAWASSWSPEGAGVPAPAPAPSWSASAGAPEAPAAPAAAPRSGGLDAEAAAMLSLRSNIQEQALSELSQLSSYRPKVDVPAGGSLTRRVPTAIPAAPEISSSDAGDAPARDADGLRSRLSSFQSGSRRGRRALTDADSGQPGAVPGQAHPEPDSQSVPPSPSW